MQFLDTRRWRVLYRSAIFSPKIGIEESSIREAEQAVIERARELYREAGPEVDVERDALDDALYALRALRNNLVLRTAA
jgi:hypothetical protein